MMSDTEVFKAHARRIHDMAVARKKSLLRFFFGSRRFATYVERTKVEALHHLLLQDTLETSLGDSDARRFAHEINCITISTMLNIDVPVNDCVLDVLHVLRSVECATAWFSFCAHLRLRTNIYHAGWNTSIPKMGFWDSVWLYGTLWCRQLIFLGGVCPLRMYY